MSLPPTLVRVRVLKAGHRRVRLWLPVVLLWPVVVALALLALVFTLLADALLLASRQPFHHATGILLWSLNAVTQTRGMNVCVANGRSLVQVAVY